MRKYLLTLSVFGIIASLLIGFDVLAQDDVVAPDEALVSPDIVISQIYGGGGNSSGSQFTHDFVELFNRGSQPVSLAGWSTQYASATGTNWLVTPLTNVTLQPGQYYLIQYASGGSNGTPLPTPDLIAPTVTVGPNMFVPNLSGTTGKLALVNSTVQLPPNSCPVSATIIDLLGYGDNTSCFEGVRAANLNNTSAPKRAAGGCSDTDNNSQDFSIGSPSPRNTSSPTNQCNLGGTLQAGITASSNVVTPPATILLTVTVIPATTPASTGLMVAGDLTEIGGMANQLFFDNGTNGDATANDNVWSYLASVPDGTAVGQKTVIATASDAEGRIATATQNITIDGLLPGEDPLLFGNPSDATPNIADENNYLMQKQQFSLSYNRSKATANWVAWRLDSSWIGQGDRQNDFRPDTSLPAGWYQVQDFDYSNSGYQRGHMTPSGDRTRSDADNSVTFLMTNIIPQIGANNEGPWADFENYCRSLAGQGNEIYIISGVEGNIGTIAQGRVVVPRVTWKVVLVLQNGDNDLQRAGRQTRAFGIIVPNQLPLNQSAPWRDFDVTVDAVEALTGHDFFSNIPKSTQELIERRPNTQ